MNFFLGFLWLVVRQLPRDLLHGMRVRAQTWEKETGTKPRLIAIGAVAALIWAYAAIQFVWWVGDLIRYVA